MNLAPHLRGRLEVLLRPCLQYQHPLLLLLSHEKQKDIGGLDRSANIAGSRSISITNAKPRIASVIIEEEGIAMFQSDIGVSSP